MKKQINYQYDTNEYLCILEENAAEPGETTYSMDLFPELELKKENEDFAEHRFSLSKNDTLNFSSEFQQSDSKIEENQNSIGVCNKKTAVAGTRIVEDKSSKRNVETTSLTKSAFSIPLFPIDGIPKDLQSIIKEWQNAYRTPQDFLAAAVFVGTAAGMGNSIKLKGKYINNTALWWLLVSPSGTGKTEPLEFALAPYKRLDSTNHKTFLKEKADYEIRKNLLLKNMKGSVLPELPIPPIEIQNIISDFTPEAMAKVHGNNPNGIVIYRDEFIGLIKDFGRYNKSGEVENMLTTWMGKSFVSNRKLDDQLRIDDPCITIVGGLQSSRLVELAKDGRSENGMIPRCIFVWPDFSEKQNYSNVIVPSECIQLYDRYVEGLLFIPTGNIISLSESAEECYADFFNKNASKLNNEKVDFIKEMYAKLDIIVLRIALIVHGMKRVCEGDKSETISPETMEYAIRIVEYFRATGLKVYNQLFSQTSEIKNNKPREVSLAEVVLFLKNHCNFTNQSKIAKLLNVSQPRINQIFSNH